ncbi:hypothetical protein [Paenibacillus sp. SYP-B4298]|uniref:hypothetical protein n=1 Tax=Paenibacillus sp. SYP-B4298 TaxID=2996034 RepID=UPI0022DE4DC4|nr:hypothetical protein [Paenibacillus sp. SYP-B4298]
MSGLRRRAVSGAAPVELPRPTSTSRRVNGKPDHPGGSLACITAAMAIDTTYREGWNHDGIGGSSP